MRDPGSRLQRILSIGTGEIGLVKLHFPGRLRKSCFVALATFLLFISEPDEHTTQIIDFFLCFLPAEASPGIQQCVGTPPVATDPVAAVHDHRIRDRMWR